MLDPDYDDHADGEGGNSQQDATPSAPQTAQSNLKHGLPFLFVLC